MTPLKLALLQSDIHWRNVEQNLLAAERQLAQLEVATIDLLLLPETFATGFAFAETGVAERRLPGDLCQQWQGSARCLYQPVT